MMMDTEDELERPVECSQHFARMRKQTKSERERIKGGRSEKWREKQRVQHQA